MWDFVEERHTQLSHDRPCQDCGHGLHTFLPCSDQCGCQPRWLPGLVLRAAV